MKTNKLLTDTRRHARLVVLVAALCVASCEVNPETKCHEEQPHEWGQWELTERPESFFKEVEVQRRTCGKCGYTEREANHPK